MLQIAQVAGLMRNLGAPLTAMDQVMVAMAGAGVQASYALLNSLRMGVPHDRARVYISALHCSRYWELMGSEVGNLLEAYAPLALQLEEAVDLGLNLDEAMILPEGHEQVERVQDILKPREVEHDFPLKPKAGKARKRKQQGAENSGDDFDQHDNGDFVDQDQAEEAEEDAGSGDARPYSAWVYRHEALWKNAPVPRVPSTMPVHHPRYQHYAANPWWHSLTPRQQDAVLLQDAYSPISEMADDDTEEIFVNTTAAVEVCMRQLSGKSFAGFLCVVTSANGSRRIVSDGEPSCRFHICFANCARCCIGLQEPERGRVWLEAGEHRTQGLGSR